MELGRGGDYEPWRSILPARIYCTKLLMEPTILLWSNDMLGFIILIIFSCGSTQKSTPCDIIHIVEVKGPFVQNGQVLQRAPLLYGK